MALVIADRVQETTSTTGTGTLSLLGPSLQHQSFVSGVGTGNQTYYCVTSGDLTNWEVGVGTVTSGSPSTLSRTTILASSNSGAAINLAGTSTVFGDAPAALFGNPGLYGPVISRVPTQANTGLTTAINQGTTTIANGATGIVLNGPTSANAISGISKAAPTPPYAIDVLFEHYTNIGGGFGVIFGWYDGTKLHGFLTFTNTSGIPIMYVGRYANTASGSSAAGIDYTGLGISTHPAAFRIRDDGTTVYFSICPGGSYDQTDDVYSIAKASGYLGSSGYSNIFFGVNRNNGKTVATLMSYTQR